MNPVGSELPDPANTSLSIVVPAVVPSVTHASLPSVPLSAEKYTLPPMVVRSSGDEDKPGRMSLTWNVPAAVPSLRHSSLSVNDGVNSSVPFRLVSSSGKEENTPVDRSATCMVPVAVPSLFHNSVPCELPLPEKNRVPPTLVICCGARPKLPVTEVTFTVPVSVPSLFHS